ncbi:unnamed protein product, partial [Dovyalis caffra]
SWCVLVAKYASKTVAYKTFSSLKPYKLNIAVASRDRCLGIAVERDHNQQQLRLDGTNESMLINLEKAFATAENGYFNAVGPAELKEVKVKYGEADILGA